MDATGPDAQTSGNSTRSSPLGPLPIAETTADLRNMFTTLRSPHEPESPPSSDNSPATKRFRILSPVTAPSGRKFGDEWWRQTREPFRPIFGHENAPQTAPAAPSGDLEHVLVEKQREVTKLRDHIRKLRATHQQEIAQLNSSAAEDADKLRAEIREVEAEVTRKQREAARVRADAASEMRKKDDQLKDLREELGILRQQHDTDKKQVSEAKDAASAATKLRLDAQMHASNAQRELNDLRAVLEGLKTARVKAEASAQAARVEANAALNDKQDLLSKITELDRAVNDRDDEISSLRADGEAKLNKALAVISDLRGDNENLRDRDHLRESSLRKLETECDRLSKIVTDQELRYSKLEQSNKQLKGEIRDLEQGISTNTLVMKLKEDVVQLNAQLTKNEGMLAERNQRVAALEQRTSPEGQSYQLREAFAQCSKLEQRVNELASEIESKNREIQRWDVQHREQTSSLHLLEKRLNASQEAERAARADLERIQTEAERVKTTAYDIEVRAMTAKQEVEDIKKEYLQHARNLESECASKIALIKSEAQQQIDALKASNQRTIADHTDELNRQQLNFNEKWEQQRREYEQQLLKLTSSENTSLEAALEKQRQQYMREYKEHMDKFAESTDERIAAIQKSAELEVQQHKQQMDAQAQTADEHAAALEVVAQKLERRYNKAVNAFQIVHEYFQQQTLRTEWIVQDLIFIKGMALRCYYQLEEDNRRVLAEAGIAPSTRVTFAGVATFVLAAVRVTRPKRPVVPHRLEQQYNDLVARSRAS